MPRAAPKQKHDFFALMAAVRESMASDYERIRSRSRQDPGTAGDQVEEDWATFLRQWLPANYQVATKGRILFEDGSSSPQLDVLVLAPSYPRGLGHQKHHFAGGVVAAFECKLTVRPRDLARHFEVAASVKRKTTRLGTPYDELISPPIIGLLAHSQELGRGRRSWKLHEVVERYQTKYAIHPRELVDVICVASSATLTLSRHILLKSRLDDEERKTLENMGLKRAVCFMYAIQDEDWEHPGIDFTGRVLAGLVQDLTQRMAYEDPALQPWADHLSKLGFFGGIGRPVYCGDDVFSRSVRVKLGSGAAGDKPRSKWGLSFP